MSDIPHSSPAAAADRLPRWTIERMSRFIDALRRTGNVAAVARAAGMSRQAAYRLRARLNAASPGHPFDRAWEAAMAPRAMFQRMTTGYAADDAPVTGGSQGVTQGDRG